MPTSGSSSPSPQTITLGPGETLRHAPDRDDIYQELLRLTEVDPRTDLQNFLFQVPNAVLELGNRRIIPDASPPPGGVDPYSRLHLLRSGLIGEDLWFTLGLEQNPRAQPLTPRTLVFRPTPNRPRLLLVIHGKYPVFRLSCGGFLVLLTVGDERHPAVTEPWRDGFNRSAAFAWFVFKYFFGAIAYGLYKPAERPTELWSVGWDYETYKAVREPGLQLPFGHPDLRLGTQQHRAVLFPPAEHLRQPLLDPWYVAEDAEGDEWVKKCNERDQSQWEELVRDTPDHWTTASRQEVARAQFDLLWHYERQLLLGVIETKVFDSPEDYTVPSEQLLRYHVRAHNRALWCCWRASQQQLLLPPGEEPGSRAQRRAWRELESWRSEQGPPAAEVEPLLFNDWEVARFGELLQQLREWGRHEPLEPPIYIRREAAHAAVVGGLGGPDYEFRPYYWVRREPRRGPPRPELYPPAAIDDDPFDILEDGEAQRLREIVRTLRGIQGGDPPVVISVSWRPADEGKHVLNVNYGAAPQAKATTELVKVVGYQGPRKRQFWAFTDTEGKQRYAVDIEAVVELLWAARPPVGVI